MQTYRKDRGRKKFPTHWSSWAWAPEYNCEYRWRQIAETGRPDDIQYEYNNSQTPRDQAVEPAYEPVVEDQAQQEIYGSPPTESGYTYKTAEEVTDDFAALSVNDNVAPGPAPNSYKAQYTPAQPNYGGTSSYTNRGSGRSSSYNTGVIASSVSNFTLPNAANQRHIFTRDPETVVDFDPNFKFHQSWEFTFGRVFKVLWSEPTGSGGTEVTRPRGKGIRKAKYGESAYDSVRRFVIIREGNGHCICLPILTYGGQGTLKKGVHAEDHTIIYTGHSAVAKDGERLTKRSIRMVPLSSRHKLDPASRINYAKVYTVEHNVKVWFVGEVAKKHEQQVVTDYNNTHQPLPDRPYYAANGEDTYEHAQGEDPSSSYTYPVASGEEAYEHAQGDGPSSSYTYPVAPEEEPSDRTLGRVEEDFEPEVLENRAGTSSVPYDAPHDYNHQPDLYDA